MSLTLRDLQSSETIHIERATVFGREGAKNDHSLPDRTVSSRHARVFPEGERWYLEDMGSSNGTFVRGQRIRHVVELQVGLRFALCRYSFEVVEVDEAEDATAMLGDAHLSSPGGPSSKRVAAVMEQAGSLARPAAMPAGDERSFSRTMPPDASHAAPRPSAPAGSADTAPEVDEPWLGYVLRTAPRALGYYLGAVPALLFNPIGSVRRLVNDQPFEPMGPKPLAAYALPPLLLNVALASLGGILVAALRGRISGRLFTGPLIGSGVAIVSAIVLGLIFHPVTAWLIGFLRGESDTRARTNYFIALMTAVPIQSLAGLAAMLVTMVDLPFLGLVPPILSLGATFIIFYVAFAWYRYFEVVKVIPVLLALGAGAASFGAATAAVTVIRSDIRALGTEAVETPVELPEGSPEEVRAQIEKQIEAMRAAGTLTPEAEEAYRRQAEATTGGRIKAPARTPTEDPPPLNKEAPSRREPAARREPDPEPEPEPKPKPQPVPEEVQPEPEARADQSPSGTTGGKSDYPEYKRRLAEVEKAIEADPTKLTRALLPLYKDLLRLQIKSRKKHRVRKGRRGSAEKQAQAKVAERLIEAETYQQTVGIVDKMYTRLFGPL